jgi:hypothetical protein
MLQTELDRHVARATGESVRRISRQGFSLLVGCAAPDEEQQPSIVDWDEVDRQRRFLGAQR